MNRFQSIFCVVDGRETEDPALERAVALAENHQAGLTVVDVIPPVRALGTRVRDANEVFGELQKTMVREHEARLATRLKAFRQRRDIDGRVLVGTSFLEVIREVLRNGHDLVVKCPESPIWLGRLFSGDDMHLLRKCPCPLLLVKRRAQKSYRRILAAIDVDDACSPKELETRQQLNSRILKMAVSFAIAESSELHVAHAWESLGELASGLVFSSGMPRDTFDDDIEDERRQQWRLLDGCIGRLKAESKSASDALDYLQPQLHLLKGPARKEIPSLAGYLAIDCIVMGTVARTGVSGFIMGNTAETILEQIDCSVLAVKPPGFVTPVGLED